MTSFDSNQIKFGVIAAVVHSLPALFASPLASGLGSSFLGVIVSGIISITGFAITLFIFYTAIKNRKILKNGFITFYEAYIEGVKISVVYTAASILLSVLFIFITTLGSLFSTNSTFGFGGPLLVVFMIISGIIGGMINGLLCSVVAAALLTRKPKTPPMTPPQTPTTPPPSV